VSVTVQAQPSRLPLAVLALAGIPAVVFGLVWGGGAVAPLVVDPGVGVRYGLPAAMLVLRLASSLTLGALLFAALALPQDDPAYEKTMQIAGWSAATWSVSSALAALLTFQSVYLEPVTATDRFGNLLALFFTETEFGRAWLMSTLLAAIVTIVSIASRAYGPVFVAGVLAVAALWPLAELGHTAGSASHNQALTSAFLHYVFTGFWVGGLAAFAMVFTILRRRPELLVAALKRFSSIALISVVVVASSGILNAYIRVGSVEQLATPYGQLVLAKTATLAVLIAAGAWYRTRTINNVSSGSVSALGSLWRTVTAELVVMGVAVGLAVALARTETPVDETPASEQLAPTPAEYLTGKPLPPEFDWTRVFTVWELDLLWALIAVMGTAFYLEGVRRLRARGDHWPISKTLFWFSGMALLFFTTSSGLYVYGVFLFSVHMVAHMILSMAIPLLWVLATPVTLAARAIEVRKDGSRGPREWILTAVNSRYLGIIGHPLVAAPLFAVSLIVFYYSPLFAWAVEDHLGHVWMTLHFLLSGYLFAQVLVDGDPHPHRPVYPLRLVIVLATMAFHAFFGLGLIMGEALLVPEWFGAMGREWGLPPLEDQQQGGELAWGLGEIPTLVLAILVTWAWSRGDEREQKRRDRRADRDDDAELQAYNAMLQERAEHDQRVAERRGAR
jgi:putative copper resistance protein D